MALFFSFDGIDGVGKSTQLRLFCQWLKARGIDPVVCRDPGGTALGERLREILLNSGPDVAISARSEMLLYMASRAQLVEEVIRPALARGETVVSDRYLLANLAYQGYAGGLPLGAVREVGAVAVDGVTPDCTFLLDMDPARAIGRLERSLDRMESRSADYRRRLREGFLAEAAAMGPSVHVIDADQDVAAVHAEITVIASVALSRT